ncbi:cytochrome b [Chryseobacterium sp. CT-SW4]|uniref:cytochrome b n=1 Tax=Chryseobacterium sp. SW-1 TaxID=3157343 RepID=UPI003B02B9A3
MKNTDNNLSVKYRKETIIIHWVSAVLLITLFILGKYMEGLPSTEKLGLLKVHIILGTLVFTLTIIRGIFLFIHRTPKLDTGYRWNNLLITLIHYGFYVVILGISVTGIMLSYKGGFLEAVFQNDSGFITHKSGGMLKAHAVLSGFMILLLILHILGIIKHIILTKENAFKRII